jgi:alkaline phosphatase D
MRTSILLGWSGLLVSLSVNCAAPLQAGLDPNNPSKESVVLVEDLLPQGIAVGDVGSNSALLWVRTDGPAIVQVEWATPSAWETISKMATVVAPVARTARLSTDADSDFTLTIRLEDLSPATRYRYHILVGRRDGRKEQLQLKLAARGVLTTLPDAGTSVPVTFAWSGDLGGQGQCRQGVDGYPIFEAMLRQRPDFFLFLGDTMYSDDPCPSPPNEPGADFTASTLSEYRARHRYQRGAEALRRLLARVPVYVVWDDHEVWNNFAGLSETRMPAGRQAFREYWPILSPADDPHRMYRTVRYGAALELFMLDTRSYRSRNADKDGPTKTMLGQAQLAWLLDRLGTSTATWRVIVTTVPLSIPKNGGLAVPGNDGWAGGPDGTGFERERQVIVDAILGQKLKNVVFIAGDVHYVQANAYDPNGDGVPDFYEFIAGPLSAASGRMSYPSPVLKPKTLVLEGGYHNFGLVRVTASSFEVSYLDNAGKVRFSYQLSAQ